MTLSDLSIKRPVFAWMIMAGLLIFGWISLGRLGISQMPDYDFPILRVDVSWPGTAPELMESEIVDRLEQALISVEKLKEMRSTIRAGTATITMEFQFERDIDSALQEVQSKISSVRLPTEVDPPIIRKSNPDDQPIVWVGLSSSRPFRELINYVDLNVKDQFQMIPGVGEITMGGFANRNLRIWLDNNKLLKYDLSIADVRRAIQSEHYEVSAGIMENERQRLTVRSMGEAPSREQVGNIRIATRGGKPIEEASFQLKDVSRVEDGLMDVQSFSRINGERGIGLGIRKIRGDNAVEVGDKVRQKVDELQKTLPPDIKIGVNFDSTYFTKEAIHETQFTLILAALITGLVVWIFLGSWNSTFNVLLSIPTSIIGAFIILYFMGFTLNMFTLLALALAVGIVVDDAIMVLENIVRHQQMGKNRMNASLDGAREITFAAVAASTAVVAIFLPVAFMSGIIGKFFFQFGVTISGAVMLSLLEAITLTPMRASQLLNKESKPGRFEEKVVAIFDKIAEVYRRFLDKALSHRWKVLGFAVLIFGLSLFVQTLIRKEFIPSQDQSLFILRFQAPVGTSLPATLEKLAVVEDYLMKHAAVKRVFAFTGGQDANSGNIFVSLKPRKERKKSQKAVIDEMRKDLKKISTLKLTPQDLSTRGFSAQRGYPVEINIRGPDWNVLREKSIEITNRLSQTGLVVDVDTDYRLGQPEVRVTPDRAKASLSKVTMQDIGEAVEAAIGSVIVGKFTSEGRRYDVRLSFESTNRANPKDIENIQVRTPYGQLIPLKNLAEIKTVPTLQTITRINRERSISITANMVAGKSQPDALKAAEKIAKEVLPENYHIYFGGGSQAYQQSFSSLWATLWLGLIIAYMILAAQFNNFVSPVIVLLALPFSLSGAFFGLFLTNNSLNLFSMIGIILLMGIVKKNSILLVEFTNKKREEGLAVREALLTASPIRLRPILMTSFATIAAALPPAMAIGPGAETRIPMSVTVIGGVLVSTLFTLFVVPAAYSLAGDLNIKKLFRKKTAAPAE